MNFNALAIRLGADWVGKAAFTKAEKATKKLEKNVKSLGSSFGLVFGTAGLGYLMKRSIQDFADAQREVTLLTNTVKNLGLEFASKDVENYINQIGTLYGVTGGEAVPAMQALLTATGSVNKSFEIFNAALDLSASRGTDITKTAKDLAQAYVGNTKAIKAYNLGITQAELATMSFDQILAIVTERTKGSATEASKTLSGQMRILAEASNQAKEKIGGSLMGALGDLTGQQGAGGAADAIGKLSDKVAELIDGMGYLAKKSKYLIYALGAVAAIGAAALAPLTVGGIAITAAIAATGASIQKTLSKNQANLGSPASWRAANEKIVKAQKKAADALAKKEAEKLAVLRKQTAEKRAQLALDKANKALSTARSQFDMEGIQLAAALQSDVSAMDRSRLETLQKIWELQNAIEQGDTSLIEKLTAQLEALTKQTIILNENFNILNKMNGLLNEIGFGRELFDNTSLNQTLSLLSQITGMKQTASSVSALVGNDPALARALLVDAPNAFAEDVVVPNLTSALVNNSKAYGTLADVSALYGMSIPTMSPNAFGPQVVVQITDNAQKLVDAVTFATQNNSANGTPVALSRNATNLAW